MKNKVLFSTAGLYPKRNTAIAFFFSAACEVLLFFLFSPKSVLFWLLTPVALLPIWKTLYMRGSYIVLQDDFVSGTSVPQNCLSVPKRFRFAYDEISFWEIHGNTVRLYHEGGCCTAQAWKTSPWVTQIIKDKATVPDNKQNTTNT